MSCLSFLQKRAKPIPSIGRTSTYNSMGSNVSLIEKTEKSRTLLNAEPSEETTATDTTERLANLRSLMEEEGLDAYIIPSVDAHGSEYPPTSEERRAFISGFTGSTGTAIVLRTEEKGAHLFTDGRYYIQAAKQLDRHWTLHKVPLVAEWNVWLVDEVRKHGKKAFAIGVDPTLITFQAASKLNEAVVPLGASLVYPSRNLIDVVWGDARPAPSDAPVVVHPLQFAGKSAQEKLQDLSHWLRQGGSDASNPIPKGSAIVIGQLDQIAWLFNLRGASIPYNPMFPAYSVVRADKEDGYKATLFVSSSILPSRSAARQYLLNDLRVDVQEYGSVFEFLLSGAWSGPGEQAKLLMTDQASWAIANAVGTPNVRLISQSESPVVMGKAVKNDVEIEGMRKAYLRDGVCWAKWAAWLDENIRVKGKQINEYDAAKALTLIREKAENYGGMESYEAISGSGENAALPHYETPVEGSRMIDRKTPYLLDSGAQYFDGTIDTTRTVHFGKPTDEQKRAFTRVLQGHIAIDTSIFPAKTTTGATLDVRARAPLWSDGYNFQHGTGHGIGSFLGVHEGPHGFSTSSGGSQTPVVLEPNMCMSNEPGYYKEGDFGIRTESIIVVRTVKTHYDQGGKDSWLCFERITMVPIDPKLIEWRLLNKQEKRWIKHHNADVASKVLPLLHDDQRARKWIKSQLC